MRNLVQSTLHRRYSIERELGHGGMATVYLAQDLRLQRQVAIKVLPPEFAAQPELRERFLRETRLAAGFSHPNIVPVHAVEEHPQLLCFVMGFVEGETLGGRVRRAGPLSAAEAIRLLQEVAWALSYAHGRGVVHRDIKPDNILIERATGRALLTDFGIARSTAGANTNLTQVGELVGTPQFMSPEQAAGETLDGRSDLYSLGVAGFFAVTGRLPFEADNAGALMAMHLTQAPPRVGTIRPELPQALASAIDRCLEKVPARRFDSGEALAAALDAMRSTRREISPSVRLFQLHSIQAFRAVGVLVALELLLLQRPLGEGSADRGIPVLIGAAIVWGIVAQLLGLVRALLRQGFSFEEVHGGMKAVLDERLEARARELAEPGSRTREAARRRVMLGAGLTGVMGYVLVYQRMRVQVAPHMYETGRAGSVILISSSVMIGLSLALVMMSNARASTLDRLNTKLWGSAFGRAAFRIAAWRLGRPGGEPVRSATAGALSLIATLPGQSQRALGDAKAQLRTLEDELRGLSERQRSVEDALAAAGDGAPATDRTLLARRTELVDDLTQARDDAIMRHERLAGALENVRLQLLRVKSGVGSPDDVRAEISSARGLARGRDG